MTRRFGSASGRTAPWRDRAVVSLRASGRSLDRLAVEQPAFGNPDEFVRAGHIVGLQAELLLQSCCFFAVEVAQAEALARPALAVVERFAAPVDRAHGRDAGARDTELIDQLVERGLWT